MADASRRDLDNPIWSSLASRHAGLARRAGEAARYPADIAPFLGVASADADVQEALDELVQAGEEWVMVGVLPRLSSRWRVQAFRPLAQMVRETPLETVDGPEVIELGEAHRQDVLDLVALVYPHYFRTRTMQLGRYLGIYIEGRLAAMAGERLGTDSAREISAVCTHPDFLGRGYARRVMAMLANDQLQRGWLPFLHVSQDNMRALEMYRRSGWQTRTELGLWSLRR